MVGDVGQPGGADDVADGVEAGDVGEVALFGVGLDVVLDEFDAEGGVEHFLDVADDADGDQHRVGLDGLGALGGFDARRGRPWWSSRPCRCGSW